MHSIFFRFAYLNYLFKLLFFYFTVLCFLWWRHNKMRKCLRGIKTFARHCKVSICWINELLIYLVTSMAKTWQTLKGVMCSCFCLPFTQLLPFKKPVRYKVLFVSLTEQKLFFSSRRTLSLVGPECGVSPWSSDSLAHWLTTCIGPPNLSQ